MTNVYAMTTTWEVNTSRADMWSVVDDALHSSDPMPWWSAVKVVSNDGTDMHLMARSPIGYSLRFRVHDLVATKPDLLTYASDGDLRGSGSTTFREVGAHTCALDFAWEVTIDRAWMQATSRLLRPMFVLGHDLVRLRARRISIGGRPRGGQPDHSTDDRHGRRLGANGLGAIGDRGEGAHGDPLVGGATALDHGDGRLGIIADVNQCLTCGPESADTHDQHNRMGLNPGERCDVVMGGQHRESA